MGRFAPASDPRLRFGNGFVKILAISNLAADIGAGFENDAETLFWLPALCLVIEFVAFSFEGVEVVGVTAYEARDLKDLRRPSKTIGYIVLLLYLAHTFSEILVVAWNDPSLGVISNDVGQTTPVNNYKTFPMLVIAAQRAQYPGLDKVFTGLLIYSSWSASNITLYVASRTLYGLMRGISYKGAPWSWIRTEFGTGVPAWCVVVSAVSFWWVALAQLAGTDETNTVSLTLVSPPIILTHMEVDRNDERSLEYLSHLRLGYSVSCILQILCLVRLGQHAFMNAVH